MTVEPNEWMAKYHDRVGVIIEPKNYQRWLEPNEAHNLPFDLLHPHPGEDLEPGASVPKLGTRRKIGQS